MKLLLLLPLPFHPPFGGANKANRLIAQILSIRHDVEIVAPAFGTPAQISLEDLQSDMARFGVEHVDDGVLRYVSGRMDVRLVLDAGRMRRYGAARIVKGRPDVAIVSSEEPTQSLLEAAVTLAPGRVVYLVYTPNFLPFGPLAFYAGQRRRRLFEQVAVIVGTSRFSADYVRHWGGFESTVCYLPVYGDRLPPQVGGFDAEYITLVNPCRYKGLDIFLGLADALPERPFAAVPTWGTTPADLTALRARANVRLLRASPDIDDILRQTRALLMPSVWLENFPLTIIEAMLRGIPVLASDVGGIREVKLGTWGVLPVRPIERFSEALDENGLLRAEVPDQDLTPWVEALRRLDDREFYEEQSEAAHEAARRFVSGVTIDSLDRVLVTVAETNRTAVGAALSGRA